MLIWDFDFNCIEQLFSSYGHMFQNHGYNLLASRTILAGQTSLLLLLFEPMESVRCNCFGAQNNNFLSRKPEVRSSGVLILRFTNVNSVTVHETMSIQLLSRAFGKGWKLLSPTFSFRVFNSEYIWKKDFKSAVYVTNVNFASVSAFEIMEWGTWFSHMQEKKLFSDIGLFRVFVWKNVSKTTSGFSDIGLQQYQHM